MEGTKTIIIDKREVEVPESCEEVRLHLHRTISDPIDARIKLLKMSKGYQWEVAIEGPDASEVITKLNEIDAQLREKFSAAD